MRESPTMSQDELGRELDTYRGDLTAYCYRMLASPFEAEDAVQETFLRAFRNIASFEGRAAMKTWLHRIATNVCLDMLRSRQRRVRPMDLGPAREPVASNLRVPTEVTWLEPIPDRLIAPQPDPSEVVASRESVRLAFIAALQRLPPRQRAALILCEVMQWKAAEVAELLDMSVASVNSALQRARATLKTNGDAMAAAPVMDDAQRALLARYVEAFERYDVARLTAVIREDAHQSMPPYDLWLAGREDMFRWWFGPGITCKGSRLVPAGTANGSPAYGHYRPNGAGGYEPWSLQVIELTPSGVEEITFFLDTQKLFPLFGLPLEFDA